MRAGALPPGAALPAVRGLAADLGLSPATVAKAYQALRQRGVVETAGRNGTRVRHRPPVAIPRAMRQPPVPEGILDLATGEPDLRLVPRLDGALRRLIRAAPTPVGYAAAGPLPELLDLARGRLAADGVPVGRAQLTLSGGALDGIERLLGAHLRPGDRVAVEDPSWANLLDLVAALGLTPVPVPVDDDGPLPDGLAHALAGGAQAAIVTSRAHNPTGAAVGATRAAALRRVLRAHPDALLIEDDHAAELADVALHTLAGTGRRWAFVRSVSKPYGPDLRLAVIAGDETTVARVAGHARIGAGWVSTVLQRLVVELWRDRSVAALVASAGASYDRRRRALLAALAARGVAATGHTGLNVWVPVPDETVTVAALRDAGYAVAPGSLYRLATPPAVRISVSNLDQPGIDPLAAAVAVAVGVNGPAGGLSA